MLAGAEGLRAAAGNDSPLAEPDDRRSTTAGIACEQAKM
jgi:hypothetical protein